MIVKNYIIHSVKTVIKYYGANGGVLNLFVLALAYAKIEKKRRTH